MTYSIKADQEQKFIHVIYSDNVTLNERKAAVIEGSERLTELGYNKVLVDFTNARLVHENLDEQDKFASMLSMHPVISKCKIAFLSESVHDSNFFIEVLARARHCDCRQCSSMEEAKSWLLEDKLISLK